MGRCWFAGLLVASACVQTESVQCDDGRTCPSGTLCRTVLDEGLCVSQDQVTACVGKSEADVCPLASSSLARCYGGVCVDASCGNSRVDPGEVCDDGNSVVGDGCSSECTSLEVCGNEIVDPVEIRDGVAYPREQCDDANVVGRDGCASSCQRESPAWEQIVLAKPGVRFATALAYDSARKRVVMFGGAFPAGAGAFSTRGDTWEWDGAGWSSVATPGSPNVRAGSVMAYDANRHRVILYGGTTSSDPGAKLGDTWEYDGSRWALLAPTHSPPARAYAAAAYDASRHRIVLFGGKDQNDTALDDTWQWDGDDWSEVSPALHPSARSGSVMAYDPKRDVVVMAGGGTQETWELDAATWRDATPVSTTDRTDQVSNFGMAYDAGSHQVITFGGRTGTGASLDTWGWDGTRWTKLLTGNGPPFRLDGTMVGDPASGNVLVFGGEFTSTCGLTPCLQTRDDTWLWATNAWSQVSFLAPQPRGTAATALDTRRGRLVIFGGEDDLTNVLGDTWELASGHWVQPTPASAPTARRGAAMAFDAARGVTVLFGGEDQSIGERDDTWTWDGTQWTPLSPSMSPSPRKDAAMAFDPVRGRIVLFGGYKYQLSGPGVLDDTWEWDGTTWTPITPPMRPSARVAARAAFDPVRRRVVLVNGNPDYLSSLVIRETWEWDGTTWTERASAPPSRQFPAVAWNAPRGRLALFGGSSGTSALNDTWELADTTWTQVTPLSLPPGRWGHSLTTAVDGSGVLAFAGSFAIQNVTADVWRLRWTSAEHYELCTLDIDHDGDGLAGCLDPDCWAACTPLCPPSTTCEPTWPRCGDGACNAALENCHLCPQDCPCTPVCGDNFCDVPETNASCPGDCS